MTGILTNSLRKTVASLDTVKGRRENGLFKAEGTKCVAELTSCFETVAVLATPGWLDANHGDAGRDVIQCRAADMRQMSSMVTPPGVIAVMRIPDRLPDLSAPSRGLVLALDALRDPGNLGTIIRVADWMGISEIWCSADTTDCYAPKVVQATMGSLGRVSVGYVDLPATLASLPGAEIYGTFLGGENIYQADLRQNGVVVVGNESHGIGDAVAASVTRRLTIPPFDPAAPTAESLNAAIATAITLSVFREKKWQRKI